jgi:acetolactate synthase-1/2/3 large subunit
LEGLSDMKLSDFVIRFLEEKGIDTAFTVSGGGCIHLIDSLRTSNMDVVCVHHEQSGLMASEGYFRMKNKMALNIVTTGPGGTNAITGLLGLWLDSIPSIIVSGQVQTNYLSEGTGCRQIGDQEFDIITTVKPMVKYAKIVKDPMEILDVLETAYQIALEGRPGPVWIDLPLDIQATDIDVSTLRKSNYVPNKYECTPHDIIDLKNLLESSTKPMIVVGNGIRISGAYEELDNFIKKNNIPVLTGVHSGVDSVDNTYEYYCGRIGILGQITSNKIIQECDLILALGTRLNIKMTGYNFNQFAPLAKKILVDVDVYEMNKHKFAIDKKIVASVHSTLKKLNNLDLNLNIEPWRAHVKKLRAEQVYFYPKHENMKEYASAYYFMSRAKNYFGDTPIITTNGSAHVVTLQTYNLKKDQRLFTNVGCATMGFGVPAAIGASIANGRQPVICMEGDGSIMMNLQELQTIVGYNLPVKTVIINNDGYLSIKITQESFFGGKEFASGKYTGVTIPNYEKISNAFGIKYFSIKTNEEIDSILEEAMEYDGACIIEIFSHPTERHEPKVTHKGIDERGKIIPGTLSDMTITDDF